MSRARKLRMLKTWIREFKRQFGVKTPIMCLLQDQSVVRESNCGEGWYTTLGLSWLNKTQTRAYIELDPDRAWEHKDGPYNTALHEFLHVMLRLRAKSNDPSDAEEQAVLLLTKLYLQKFAMD